MITNILWDCDGVLVDSELISCSHAVEELHKVGIEIDLEYFISKYAGTSRKNIYKKIYEETGINPDKIIDPIGYEERRINKFRKKLKPMESVSEVIPKISLPQSIVSGSPISRIRAMLEITKLGHFFNEDKIFSSAHLKNGKPYPDIYLSVVRKLSVNAKECIAIEDSLNGVMASVRAGIFTIGFVGGEHIKDKQVHSEILQKLGAKFTTEHMADIPDLIAKIENESNISNL